MSETVLIVDDEDSVRRTFQEWLDRSGLDCRVLTAADAESALQHANRQPIDLAILDWNLGSGSDGLQLLEDLAEFNPDIVAILVTGFAAQATPLEALRMGVRDYLDKSHDLNRDTFLAAVRKQLERIAPAKRQRELTQSLFAFREAVEKVLPLVQSAAALNDPVPLPQAITSLFRFLLRGTGAADGVLLVHHAAAAGESVRVYDTQGQKYAVELVPFASSLAAGVVGMQEPCLMTDLDAAGVELQPFERGRSSILAVPLNVGPGVQVVIEAFDKVGGPFTDADRRLALLAAELGAEVLRQALAERQTHRLLLDAVAAALGAGESLESALRGAAARPEQPPPLAVLEGLRRGLESAPGASVVDADATLQLAEAVRALAVRHGPAAVRHCTRLVQGLRELLDEITGG
jgi:two-component system, NtrC family, nitrogen regulation response regulator NtrX